MILNLLKRKLFNFEKYFLNNIELVSAKYTENLYAIIKLFWNTGKPPFLVPTL